MSCRSKQSPRDSSRKLSAEAKDLADVFFFETVVRLHRAGEGEPYTGLKPAGTPVSPAVEAVDRAVAGGSSEPILILLGDAVRQGVERRFSQVNQRPASDKDLDARREQVRVYVSFMHYVERLYEAACAGEGNSHAHSQPPAK